MQNFVENYCIKGKDNKNITKEEAIVFMNYVEDRTKSGKSNFSICKELFGCYSNVKFYRILELCNSLLNK